jgi:cyclic pyranopterin phosphate synthase
VTLSHVDSSGRARMVDVGPKDPTDRTALAEGLIRMSPEALEAVERQKGPKGDVLRTAELAGLTAAKRTWELVPLCHQIALTSVEVTAEADASIPGVRVRGRARAHARTGVEMEALTAVSVALLTVYDMVKAMGHDLEINEVRLLEKTGGKSGNWRRKPSRK